MEDVLVVMENVNMNAIRKVVIVGLGALGMMYGKKIQDGTNDAANPVFLMNRERKIRHQSDCFEVNGEKCSFNILTPDEYDEKADLVIFATKIHGLRAAAELAIPAVDGHTAIISVLNGISSEDILADYFPRKQIIDCVAIGMDAMRLGSELHYQNMGRLQIGCHTDDQQDRLDEIANFFAQKNMPYEVCDDIRHAMWNKFMINVGINQTCMVYKTTYKAAVTPGPLMDDMIGAMKEVIEVAKAEGISLTKHDLDQDLDILKGLNPDGYPSMRQDSIAKRPSEVDLFAGTVTALAAKHGISVPINEKYLRTIREIEAEY